MPKIGNVISVRKAAKTTPTNEWMNPKQHASKNIVTAAERGELFTESNSSARLFHHYDWDYVS